MSNKEWEWAAEEAKKALGYATFEYVEEWGEVVEMAKEILASLHEEEFEDTREEFAEEYKIYLKTPRWLKLREGILVANNYKCIDCGKIASEVHHLSYDNLGKFEEIEDLLPLCSTCHKHRHGIKQNPPPEPPKKDDNSFGKFFIPPDRELLDFKGKKDLANFLLKQ